MQSKTSYVLDLLDQIEKQGELLADKDKTINKLVNDNLEKENMINELLGSSMRAEKPSSLL